MILSIETSVKNCSISLLKEGKEIGFYCFEKEETASQSLLLKIGKLLEETKVKKNELKLVAVSNGPGSLTGVRIGISVGRGLAAALGIKCVGVSLLKALSLISSHNFVVSLVSAGRFRSYWQSFKDAEEGLIYLINNEEIKNLLEENSKAVFVFEQGVSAFIPNIILKSRKLICPKNLSGLIGREAFENFKYGKHINPFPIYIEETCFKKLKPNLT